MRKLVILAVLLAACTNQTSGDPYNITLRFSGTLSDSQKAAFNNAAARWSQVIKTGFASTSLTLAADECDTGFAAFNGTVDDILIDAQVVPIDGAGGVLGQAGPCATRQSDNLTLYGVMQFDSADLASLETKGQLASTIFHEMGHVLGIGTLWNQGGRALLQGATGDNPRFVGTRAVAEWQTLGGSGNVPVENCLDGSNNPIPNCGSGTRNSHWREAIFITEIMTGYLDKGSNPLSRVTIGSMEDLGYTVNYGAADSFSLVKAQSESTGKQPLNIRLIYPKWSVAP